MLEVMPKSDHWKISSMWLLFRTWRRQTWILRTQVRYATFRSPRHRRMDHEVQTSVVELFGMANFAYPGQRLEVVELNYWKRRSTVIENASEVW